MQLRLVYATRVLAVVDSLQGKQRKRVCISVTDPNKVNSSTEKEILTE